MLPKGTNRELHDTIQGPALLEQMGRPWHNGDLDRSTQLRSGRLVQIQHFEVPTTDDQQGGRLNPWQRVPGEVWPTPSRDHQLNMIRNFRSGDERRRCACAGAE